MMKKSKIEKDEMYVINQPKHLLLSIILMDNNYYPIQEEIHNNICRLSEVSDIVFIFSDNHFNNSGIYKDKLTSLYQGCAFVDSQGNLPRTIFKVLLYDKEIFSRHIGITISLCQDLIFDDPEKLIKNLEKVNQSRIVKPIFNIYRLSSDEIYQFYHNEESIIENLSDYSFWPISNLFPKIKMEEDRDAVDCRFCTWGSYSKVLYFRNSTINIFLEQLVSKEEDFYKFIDTFTDPNPGYLFSGLVKKNGIECLDYSIEDLEVNEI